MAIIHELDTGLWQVEFQENSDGVIARSTSELNQEVLQSIGYEVVQKTLDILSVKGVLSAYVKRPAVTSIGVYWTNSKSVLYFQSLFDIPMSVSVQVKQFDTSGNEIMHPPPAEPIWNESFRYYRLSQSSNDLFEAYRNLFLAFEALLNTICSKNKREGEKA